MPRKKLDDLGPAKAVPKTEPTVDTEPTQEYVPEPVAPAPQPAPPVRKTVTMDADVAARADTNGDGHISNEEYEMEMEFKRKALEDQDAMRDAQRKMAWFALFGMLLYPFAVVLAVFAGLNQASEILGDMAATYFVSVAAIVAAFFGGQAVTANKSSSSGSSRKR